MVEHQTKITNEELLVQYHAEQDEEKKEELKEEFFNNNIRFSRYIAKKYLNVGLEFEELCLYAAEGMLHAFYAFDPSKGVYFTTYAATCIHNQIKMELRKMRTYRNKAFSFEFVLAMDTNSENELKLEDILFDEKENRKFDDIFDIPEARELYRVIKKALKPRDLKIFTEIVIAETPKLQHEIANEFGISQSYVSRMVKDVERRAKQAVANHYLQQERELTKKRVGVCKIKS